MKKLYIKAIGALLLGGSMVGCGDSFLDTDIYNGIDIDSGLNSVTNIGYALNGTYYRLFYYYFAGNYATSFGDIASDLSYWNHETNHFSDIYTFAPTSTDLYLEDIWDYGYKVVDNSSRIIKAGTEMTVEESEEAELDMYLAEAYALRAYGHFVLVNIFGHQVKVDGQDFSSKPGIVLVDQPITPSDKVSRATVGETYTSIIKDLKLAIEYFDKAGQSKGTPLYFNPAAVWGLLSRVYLYMEDYQNSIDAAQKALTIGGVSTLATTDASYKALYNGELSNNESFFCLAINTTTNWSANSCGTLWSTYSYSPSPYLQSIMAENDVRRAVWGWASNTTPSVPWFTSGKFGAFGLGGNSAYGTNYLINAPEMFLNQAESYVKQKNADNAKAALLTVAKRNPAITSVDDLPSDLTALMSFIQEERARELFQEGHRLYDLRRWDVKANLYATGAPEIDWLLKNVKVSDCVYPIPDAEINTKAGVTQNEGWNSTFPKM